MRKCILLLFIVILYGYPLISKAECTDFCIHSVSLFQDYDSYYDSSVFYANKEANIEINIKNFNHSALNITDPSIFKNIDF